MVRERSSCWSLSVSQERASRKYASKSFLTTVALIQFNSVVGTTDTGATALTSTRLTGRYSP